MFFFNRNDSFLRSAPKQNGSHRACRLDKSLIARTSSHDPMWKLTSWQENVPILGQIEWWPSFRFQSAAARASISSHVLYNASEGRTVLSTPSLRRMGCAQW